LSATTRTFGRKTAKILPKLTLHKTELAKKLATEDKDWHEFIQLRKGTKEPRFLRLKKVGGLDKIHKLKETEIVE